MTTTEITTRTQAGLTRPFTSEEEAVIRTELVPGLTDGQFAVFAQVCQHTGLSPFKREIYAVVRKTKDGPKMAIQVGIDAFRKQAAADPNYNGQTAPEWCGPDGVWKQVWSNIEPPFAARIGVYRKGAEHPTWGVAHYEEYVQTNYKGEPNPMWQRMARNQLVKCAESLALRKALPERLGGIYTTDEMAQAEVAAPEYLTDEQVEELVALAVRAGRDATHARARAEKLTLDKFDAALAAMQRLVDEAEQVEDVDAVEVEA